MIRNLPERWDFEADVVALGSGERVGHGVADQRVGVRIACAVDRDCAGQRQVLQVGRERHVTAD